MLQIPQEKDSYKGSIVSHWCLKKKNIDANIKDDQLLISMSSLWCPTKEQQDDQVQPGWHRYCRALEWMHLRRAHRPRFGCFTCCRKPLPPSLTAWRQLGARLWVRQQPEPTSHFAPHSSLLMTPTRLTETRIQPLSRLAHSPLLRCHPPHSLTALRPSCRLAAAHMIRASTQPPVLPRPTTPDRSVVAGTVQCNRVGRLAGEGGSRQPAPENTTPVLPPDTHPLLRLPIFSTSKLTDPRSGDLAHKSNPHVYKIDAHSTYQKRNNIFSSSSKLLRIIRPIMQAMMWANNGEKFSLMLSVTAWSLVIDQLDMRTRWVGLVSFKTPCFPCRLCCFYTIVEILKALFILEAINILVQIPFNH